MCMGFAVERKTSAHRHSSVEIDGKVASKECLLPQLEVLALHDGEKLLFFPCREKDVRRSSSNDLTPSGSGTRNHECAVINLARRKSSTRSKT